MAEYDLPILEYDSDKSAVIIPNHDNISVQLPSKAVFAFLGDEIDQYALSRKATIVANFESATKVYPIYVLEEKVEKKVKEDANSEVEEETQKICLVQAPVGAPAAVQILDWLISYGVREVVSAGSCGSLVDYAENVFLVPYKALRDEGTSYHYLPPSRYVDVSERSGVLFCKLCRRIICLIMKLKRGLRMGSSVRLRRKLLIVSRRDARLLKWSVLL